MVLLSTLQTSLDTNDIHELICRLKTCLSPSQVNPPLSHHQPPLSHPQPPLSHLQPPLLSHLPIHLPIHLPSQIRKCGNLQEETWGYLVMGKRSHQILTWSCSLNSPFRMIQSPEKLVGNHLINLYRRTLELFVTNMCDRLTWHGTHILFPRALVLHS